MFLLEPTMSKFSLLPWWSWLTSKLVSTVFFGFSVSLVCGGLGRLPPTEGCFQAHSGLDTCRHARDQKMPNLPRFTSDIDIESLLQTFFSLKRMLALVTLNSDADTPVYVAMSRVSCYIVWRGGLGVGKALCLGYKHNQWLPITPALPEYADTTGIWKEKRNFKEGIV